jgi:hypothetical protein
MTLICLLLKQNILAHQKILINCSLSDNLVKFPKKRLALALAADVKAFQV